MAKDPAFSRNERYKRETSLFPSANIVRNEKPKGEEGRSKVLNVWSVIWLPSGPTCLPLLRAALPPSLLCDYNNVHLGLFISFQVLLAFVCLIVGFAFSFAVLFHGNDQFRNSWRAVVKTVVMMMGEYEYGALFSDEKNGSSFLPATSRVVFLAFVMLASIVLMNLMIGLAVNDIQGLEKEVRSVDTLTHLPSIFIT